MANDKKFVVKNGLQTQNISFVDSSGNTITTSMLSTDTLSFSGDSGQLFSITDSLSGTIFAVNDISGVPSIEVDDDGTIRFAETFGNVLIGTAVDDGTNKLQVDGNIYTSSNLIVDGDLIINGTTTTIDTATLQVQDKNIVLNYGTGDTSSSADGAGITIQDAVNASTDATILWNTSTNTFDFSHGITATGYNKSNWDTAYGWGNHADAGYLTSQTAEVNDLTASVTWADVPDTNITQSSVTQHQAALSITESQISDLQAYSTIEGLTKVGGAGTNYNSTTEGSQFTWYCSNTSSNLGNTWLKVADIVLPDEAYSACSFSATYLTGDNNYGNNDYLNRYENFISIVRDADATANSDTDAAFVRGRSDRIRVYKTATGVYELQAFHPSANAKFAVEVKVWTQKPNSITPALTAAAGTNTGGTAYTVLLSSSNDSIKNYFGNTDISNLLIDGSTAISSGRQGTLTSLYITSTADPIDGTLSFIPNSSIGDLGVRIQPNIIAPGGTTYQHWTDFRSNTRVPHNVRVGAVLNVISSIEINGTEVINSSGNWVGGGNISEFTNDSGYLTSETSHADVLVDGDFTSEGFMKTDGSGTYSVDSNTYITSAGTNFTSTLGIHRTSPTFTINDTDATNATEQTGWISFQRQGTEKAWIGYGSSSNANFTIKNTEGSVTVESGLVVNGNATVSNLTLANPGIGSTSTINFAKTSDTAQIRVTESNADATEFQFYMADNPSSASDKFNWYISSWQGAGSAWKPLEFSAYDTRINSVDTIFNGNLYIGNQPYISTGGVIGSVIEVKTGTLSLTVDVSNFTGSQTHVYIELTTDGTTFTAYNRKSTSGRTAYVTDVAITGTAQVITQGITVTFSGTTGGVAGDNWEFGAWGAGIVDISTQLEVDTIVEHTADAGVTVEGITLKDSSVAVGATTVIDSSGNWVGGGNISEFTNDSGYLTSETSHADVLVDGDFANNGLMKRTGAGTYTTITDSSANWDTAYGWGNHASAGYANGAKKEWTSLTGASGDWFPLFKLDDANQGGAIVTLKTYAHTSVTFAVGEGYSTSNKSSISILNSTNNDNGAWAGVDALRIRQNGKVEAQLSWSTGPTVDIEIQIVGPNANSIIVYNTLETSADTDDIVDSVSVTTNGLMRGLVLEGKDSIRINGTTVVDSSRNLTNIGNITSNGTTSLAKITPSTGATTVLGTTLNASNASASTYTNLTSISALSEIVNTTSVAKTADTLYGLKAEAKISSYAGAVSGTIDVTNMYGVYSSISAFELGGAVTATNAYGVYLTTDIAGGAAFTNFYGLYIDNPTGSLDYAIYSSSGTNYFGGSVLIGTTSETNLGDDTEPRLVLDGVGYLIDRDGSTNRDRLWGTIEARRVAPSKLTYAEAGNIGTNEDLVNFPNVYGEADLAAIDNGETFTYADAITAVESHGARLPTLQELMAGVGQGSGQGYDAEYLWTQTFAGHRKVWVCKGRFDTAPDAKIVDIDDPAEVYRCRAFFDVSKANMPVYYDNSGEINGTLNGNVNGTLDGLDSTAFIRSNVDDEFSGILTTTGPTPILFGAASQGISYSPTEGGTAASRYFLRFDITDDASYPYLTNRTPSGDVAIFSGDTTGGNEIERIRFKGGDGTQDIEISNARLGIGTTTVNKDLQVSFNNTDTTVTSGNGLAGGVAGDGLLIYNENTTAGVYANLDFRAGTADGRIAYKFSGTENQGDFHFITDNSGSPEIQMTLTNGGYLGLNITSPETPFHIYEAAAAPVLATFHNYQADINPNGTQGNFIDFKMTDDNATFTPQVRIGMLVQDYSGDAGIPSEGTGNFVVYTGYGTDNAGAGTLAERFRVRETGDVDVVSGSLLIGGTEVVDSNRNLTNIADITANGTHVLSGVTKIGGAGSTYSSSTEGSQFTWYCSNTSSSLGNTWLKVADIVLPDEAYSACAFSATYITGDNNYGNHDYLRRFENFISIVRDADATPNSDPDTAYIRGRSDRIRVYKTATGTYELQAYHPSANAKFSVEVKVWTQKPDAITPAFTAAAGTLTGGTAYTVSLTDTNDGVTHFLGNTDLYTLDLQGTTVIDSSRNLTNIGTYSGSGVASFTNGTNSLGSTGGAVKITGGLGVGYNIYAGQIVSAGGGFRVGSTSATAVEVIDSSRNLVNIGNTTISGNLQIDNGSNYGDVEFSQTSTYGNGTLQIQPKTIPGSGTADYFTHFANNGTIGSGGATRHSISVDGNIQIGGTTVIDSSRNLNNLESVNLPYNKRVNFGDATNGQGYIRYGDFSTAPNYFTFGLSNGTTSNPNGVILSLNGKNLLIVNGLNTKITLNGDTGAGVFTGPVTGSNLNIANWDTAYTYSQVGHLPLSGGTLTGTLNGTVAIMSSRVQTAEIRSSTAQQLVLNAGESASYATGQTNEILYVNAEAGLQINSSPDNWQSLWAGRYTATICDNNGQSSFPGNVSVNGLLSATTKSFIIDHPTKEGMKLRYGSLEGPENGVYVRGKLEKGNVIQLPDYWTGLVDESTITVQLTAVGKPKNLYVAKIEDNTVVVKNASWFSNNTECFYTVYAERKDVEKLMVEY